MEVEVEAIKDNLISYVYDSFFTNIFAECHKICSSDLLGLN